jgi:hypothetical protein
MEQHMTALKDRDETTDIAAPALCVDASEAAIEYSRAARAGRIHDHIESAVIDATETEMAAPVRIAELAQVTKLPDTVDGVEHELGCVPADLLADVVRIAYPAGVYTVSLWEGLDSEREHFVAGRQTGSWRVTRELQIFKTHEGRVSMVDTTEEAENAIREIESRYADESSTGVW